MYLKCFAIGDLATNCYLIADEKTKQAAIIDPGGEVDEVMATIEKHHFTPTLLLLTHGHIDHIWGVEELKKRYNLQYVSMITTRPNSLPQRRTSLPI